MSIKSLLLFLLIAGAIAWMFVGQKTAEQPADTRSLTAPQQRQMQKAANLEKDLQQQLDQRMQASPSE